MMHSLFSASNEIGADTSGWVAPKCESDGETDNEMEVERSLSFDSDIENENLPSSSTPVMQPTNHNAPSSSAQNISLLLLYSSSSTIQNANAAAPQQLWPDWTPPSGRYRALYDDFPDFTKAVFETATSNSTPPDLDISGQSVGELAMAFVNTIKAAVASSDFSHILSPQRNFTMCILSHGMLTIGGPIFSLTLMTHTMSLASHAYVSTDCCEDLMILGCLAALLLLHGIAPKPLGPAIIQFAANRCKLGSLTWDFVGEYHPELRALLDIWKMMGPSGDIIPFQSYFATYHDLEAS
ncbi:hypothetical protein DFH08DRAFT_954977 [Mycena albidolilacea]|uniref:Uncharacterized protein n=1 Tax=Mycena albidolilacea TaxID=1033008 RepID=A0AAD7AED4_9AGAR|nr:hypothetical protein DFH08DRAFT_954977 [Mycena albidolilacea]